MRVSTRRSRGKRVGTEMKTGKKKSGIRKVENREEGDRG